VHISVSRINTYTGCPALYYFRYVRQIETPQPSYFARGRAVHGGIEYNLHQKIETRQDLPLKQVKDFAASCFDEEAKRTDWGFEDKGKTLDESLSLVELYHNKIAPEVQPIAVEKKLEVEFPGVDYSLLGYADVITEDRWIRDIKTVKRTPSDDAVIGNLQLCAYSLMYQMEYENEETGVALDYLVKLKTPKAKTLRTTVTDADHQRFLKIMEAVATNIEQENFYPNHTYMMCGPHKCPYWDVCIKEW